CSNDGKVIFFSEYKAVKTVSSLFTRICPLSVDDIHLIIASTIVGIFAFSLSQSNEYDEGIKYLNKFQSLIIDIHFKRREIVKNYWDPPRDYRGAKDLLIYDYAKVYNKKLQLHFENQEALGDYSTITLDSLCNTLRMFKNIDSSIYNPALSDLMYKNVGTQNVVDISPYNLSDLSKIQIKFSQFSQNNRPIVILNFEKNREWIGSTECYDFPALKFPIRTEISYFEVLHENGLWDNQNEEPLLPKLRYLQSNIGSFNIVEARKIFKDLSNKKRIGDPKELEVAGVKISSELIYLLGPFILLTLLT
ncbi:hypothetical protein, partial [Spirosoma harenae]